MLKTLDPADVGRFLCLFGTYKAVMVKYGCMDPAVSRCVELKLLEQLSRSGVEVVDNDSLLKHLEALQEVDKAKRKTKIVQSVTDLKFTFKISEDLSVSITKFIAEIEALLVGVKLEPGIESLFCREVIKHLPNIFYQGANAKQTQENKVWFKWLELRDALPRESLLLAHFSLNEDNLTPMFSNNNGSSKIKFEANQVNEISADSVETPSRLEKQRGFAAKFK